MAEVARHGGVVIGEASDLNVSASKVGPFQRPELGPWLHDRHDEFDAVFWWRMDRAVRSMADLHELAAWAKRHRKRLFFAVGPGGGPMELDMSSPVAELIATILAFAAQMESQAITERVTSSHSYLRRHGRWGGGTYPYGYMPVPNPEGEGWVLVKDPETAPVVEELVKRVLAGESMNAVCIDFNGRGTPTPRDYSETKRGKARNDGKGPRRWSTSTTAVILRGRALLGVAEHEGVVIADADGMPLQRAEPLISAAQWRLLQTRLDSTSNGNRTRTTGANPLLNVAHCECGQPLYSRTYLKKGNRYSYHFCPGRFTFKTGCVNPMVKSEWLMSATEDTIMATVGGLEVVERRFVPGSDETARLEAVEERMESLREDRIAGLYSGARGDAEFRSMYLKLQAQREDLATKPQTPDHWQEIATGRTYSDVWKDFDTDADRRAFLLTTGIRVVVHAEPVQTRSLFDGAPDSEGSRLTVSVPTDLARRVEQHAKVTGTIGRRVRKGSA